jgi:hypothetical protein
MLIIRQVVRVIRWQWQQGWSGGVGGAGAGWRCRQIQAAQGDTAVAV